MNQQARLLRIYTDEAAYVGDRKVYEVVASRARDAGLAGVTVLEALIGFGRSAHVHRRHVLESDRAVVVAVPLVRVVQHAVDVCAAAGPESPS